MNAVHRGTLAAVLALAVAAPAMVTGASAETIQLAQQEERRFLPRLFNRGRDDADRSQQVDTSLRLDQLESQVRSLTGQVEQLSFQVQTLTRTLQAQGTALPDTPPPIRQRFDDPATGQDGSGDGSSATLGAPAQNLGTLQLPPATVPGPGGGAVGGGGGPIDLSALNRGADGSTPSPPADTGQPSATLPSVPQAPAGEQPVGGSAAVTTAAASQSSAAFENARALLASERHLEAEAEFRQFIDTYPNDPRLGEAQFLLGESMLGRGAHREAANAFLASYTDHPDSAKAPESLLKLGVSLHGMGEREAACSSFEELLASYPNASQEVLQQARQQQQAVGCS